MDQVHANLEILSRGETVEPDADEHAAVEAAKQEADKAHEDIKSDPEFVELNVTEEEASKS
jgi:hypothetical protein